MRVRVGREGRGGCGARCDYLMGRREDMGWERGSVSSAWMECAHRYCTVGCVVVGAVAQSGYEECRIGGYWAADGVPVNRVQY